MRNSRILAFALLIAALCAVPAFGHGGNTDSYGGHHDYENVSGLGGYHYHHGYEAHLHDNGYCPIIEELMPISPDDPDYYGPEKDTSSSGSSNVSSSYHESDEIRRWKEYKLRGYNVTSDHPILAAQIGDGRTIYDYEYPWWDVSCWELWKQILGLGASLIFLYFGILIRTSPVEGKGTKGIAIGTIGTAGFGLLILWQVAMMNA